MSGAGESNEKTPPHSYGNISEHHWSRTRQGMNQEALDYYRQRSKAPGVESGGAERNFYCMACDGVIAYEHEGTNCPHCGAAIDEKVKRYFNWVEINEPTSGDLKPLLKIALPIAVALIALVLWLWLR